MSTNKNDPLIESLMGLAVAAAPLIRRARESGLFREAANAETVDATVMKETVKVDEPAPAADAKAAEPKAAGPAPQDTSALEALIVRQAMRINELEAEVARLKAAQKRAKKPASPKKPTK